MSAYAALQQEEFLKKMMDTTTKHQREVGVNSLIVAEVISSGKSSTTAMKESQKWNNLMSNDIHKINLKELKVVYLLKLILTY